MPSQNLLIENYNPAILDTVNVTFNLPVHNVGMFYPSNLHYCILYINMNLGSSL